MLLSVDTKPAINRYPLLDFGDPDPGLLDLRGQQGRASCSLFCTCTCAMSGLVPAAKVSVWSPCRSRRIGRQIQQVIEPAHLLLDHLHDGIFDGLGGGAR